MNPISAIHECFQRLHTGDHFRVVERADSEEKLRKGFRAHLGLLGHRRGRPAENHPSGLVDPVIKGGTQLGGEQGRLFLRDVGHLGDILRTTHCNVGLHFFQTGEINGGNCLRLWAGDADGKFAADTVGMHHDKRLGFGGACGTDQGNHELFRRLRDIYEDALASL